ncbi:DNase I-like protein, partial [Trametes sanguinea]
MNLPTDHTVPAIVTRNGEAEEHADLLVDACASDALPANGHEPAIVCDEGASKPRKTRARIRLATLNIKGFGRHSSTDGSDKWLSVGTIMRSHRLAIMAVQEAHLSAERTELLNKLYASTLTVVSSPHPDAPTTSGGIAVVLSKRHIGGRPLKTYTVVPGRAVLIEYPWSTTRILSVLAVYAPNEAAANATFWNNIRTYLAGNDTRPRRAPDVMLGDFNMVEDALDRLPTRPDPEAVTGAFAKLLRELHMRDSWRKAHQTDRVYTYLHSNGTSQSRLDRIYVAKDLLNAAAEWDHVVPPLSTDHSLVTISLANYQAPYVGRGRWRMPDSLLTDAPFHDTMKRLGKELQEALTNMNGRTQDCNPQTAYATFKRALGEEAKKRTKAKMSSLNGRI